MEYLRDNFDAIDFIFDFLKNARRLSVSYIKELHSLITRNQDTTDAVDQFGNHQKIPLLKGRFKLLPNNPTRGDVVYNYCPPEHVDAEMDRLTSIFHEELGDSHILARAAFLHHAFVQTHPFQDGNGRIARLLASFVLIKEGLFPLAIDRDERTRYIVALEKADNHIYQPLVDIFADNQIASIERALNWKTVESATGYDAVLDILTRKLSEYRAAVTEQQNRLSSTLKNSIIMQIFHCASAGPECSSKSTHPRNIAWSSLSIITATTTTRSLSERFSQN